MKEKSFKTKSILFLILTALFLMLPANNVKAEETKAVQPFMCSNAAVQTEDVTMAGTAYSDAVLFTMGYTGMSTGNTAEAVYNFDGKYSSMTFKTGYSKGDERNAFLTIIADGRTIVDKKEISYENVPITQTVQLGGVKQLIIRYESDGYDKTRYAVGNVKTVRSSSAKDEVLVSDEFFDITRYQLKYGDMQTGTFSMGGHEYEGGYIFDMGYGFGRGYTDQVSFNFDGKYKKMTFEIARYDGDKSISYTRSAYLTIKADDAVVAGYDKKELKWSDIALPVEVNLNGVTQLTISVNSDGYDLVNWGIGNIQLVSDGHAHGILFDKVDVKVTSDQPTYDLNPRVYPSDAVNKNYEIESDSEAVVSVDEEGVVTGHYKGSAVITATTEDGEHMYSAIVKSELPAFNLVNKYKTKYVLDASDELWGEGDLIYILQDSGDGSLAGHLAKTYVEAGRVITEGYGGLINGLDKVLGLDIDIENDYDILIADLVEGTMGIDGYENLINEELLSAMSETITYLGALTDVGSGLLAEEVLTDFGELPDVINSSTQAKWGEMKKLFTSKVTYENAGKMFATLGSAVNFASATANGCKDVGDLMEYYVLCNAYIRANSSYADVITATANKMKGKNAVMSTALTAAANRFSVSLKEASEEQAVDFYLRAGKETAEYALRTGAIIKETLDTFVGKHPIWYAIKNGVSLGTTCANRLTATDDRYLFGKMLHMSGFMAEGMHQVVLDRKNAFAKKDSFENAVALSEAIELYLNLQILSCEYGYDYLMSYVTCEMGEAGQYLFQAYDDEIEAANELLRYRTKLIQLKESAYWVGIGGDGSILGFVIACPVTVVIETKDGQEIARMETGKVTVSEGYEGIYRLHGSSKEKKLGFYNPEEHNVKIITEDGSKMDILLYQTEMGDMVQTSQYEDLAFGNQETFQVTKEGYVTKNNNTVTPDEYYKFVNPFTDIPEGKWYTKEVLWALRKGITSGTTATQFSPNNGCTRAEVVSFLWRAAGCPEPQSTENPFTDVPEGKWYTKAVLWAAENKITSGTTPTTFSPKDTCTRGEIVAFMYRNAKSPEVQNVQNEFTDVPEGKWYTAPVLWAAKQGVTSGLTPTTFAPNATCTRAQIVTFLYRYYTEL